MGRMHARHLPTPSRLLGPYPLPPSAVPPHPPTTTTYIAASNKPAWASSGEYGTESLRGVIERGRRSCGIFIVRRCRVVVQCGRVGVGVGGVLGIKFIFMVPCPAWRDSSLSLSHAMLSIDFPLFSNQLPHCPESVATSYFPLHPAVDVDDEICTASYDVRSL